MTSSDQLRAAIERRRSLPLVLGVVGIIAAFAAGHFSTQFYRSYLFAFEFWLSISLGSIALIMVHHLTGGWWGFPVRRVAEAASRVMPLMFVLFIPMFFGISKVYSWAQPDAISADKILQAKQWYLNPHGFVSRAIFYFIIWNLFAFLMSKWSKEQDASGDPAIAGRMTAWSGPGLILWSGCVTMAAVDWIMSLEPHWYSTIYGMIFMVLALLAGMAFCVFVFRMLSDYEPLKSLVQPTKLLDLGNLTLAFVLLITYLSFDQLLIQWAGNLKDEIPWYATRVFGGWEPVAVILIICHFFAPFFLLLQRGVKGRIRVLACVMMGLLVVTVLNLYWLIEPAYDTAGPKFHILDLCAFVGIGGLWLWMFLTQLTKMPLLPVHDTRLAAVLEPEHGD